MSRKGFSALIALFVIIVATAIGLICYYELHPIGNIPAISAISNRGRPEISNQIPTNEVQSSSTLSSQPASVHAAADSVGAAGDTAASKNTSPDLSSLHLSINAEVAPLLTDPLGRRVGLSAPSSTPFSEIPDGGYYVDEIGDFGGSMKSNTIDISQPTPGMYLLTLNGPPQQLYGFTIRVVTKNGTFESPIERTGILDEQPPQSFQLLITTAPNAQSTLVPMNN